MAESKQPQLKTQDLETLDVTKLTALTPEVVSTIHGPSIICLSHSFIQILTLYFFREQ